MSVQIIESSMFYLKTLWSILLAALDHNVHVFRKLLGDISRKLRKKSVVC